MPEETNNSPATGTEASEGAIVEAGKVSRWLTENGFAHEIL